MSKTKGRVTNGCSILLAYFALTGTIGSTAIAAPTYQDGRINNVAFVGSSVFIQLDSGLPDNCAGTPAGWMIITDSRKPMQSFVMGLWMRGDAAQVTMRVFTSGVTGTGYCEINQIDPAG